MVPGTGLAAVARRQVASVPGNAERLAVVTQKPGQPRAIAATSLDRKRRLAKPTRPHQQLPIPGHRRRHRQRLDQPTKPVKRHRHMPLLVRIHPNCHRPPGHVASPHRLATGLDRAVSGKGTQASIRSPASRTTRRRETGRFEGKPQRPPAWLRVIPPPRRTLSHAPDGRSQPDATQHGCVGRVCQRCRVSTPGAVPGAVLGISTLRLHRTLQGAH
jgi:hypothetical protein